MTPSAALVPFGDETSPIWIWNLGARIPVSHVEDAARWAEQQAVFTDELSETSALALRQLAKVQWSTLMAKVVPELERLIAEDKAQGRPATHRARLGLFSFHEPLQE